MISGWRNRFAGGGLAAGGRLAGGGLADGRRLIGGKLVAAMVLSIGCALLIGCSDDSQSSASSTAVSSGPGSGGGGAGGGGAGGGAGHGGDAGSGGATAGGGGGVPSTCSAALVWPTSGSSAQTVVHDAYGPRILPGGYDWHQGIDLPGRNDDGGFFDPVHAAAAGEILRIGNLPGNGGGAVAYFSQFAGNIIILRHSAADTGLDSEVIHTLYLHLDTLPLSAFSARLGGTMQAIDLHEYYYLDGADMTDTNRGTQRDILKSSGQPINEHPRFAQGDAMAIIGDSGATFEHLHFEVRDKADATGMASPLSRVWARNPYQYLPHGDTAAHTLMLDEPAADQLRLEIQLTRDLVAAGERVTGMQELDIEHVRFEIRQGDRLIDSRAFSFFEDINTQGTSSFADGELGFDHPDFLSNNYQPAEPDRSLGGVDVTLTPAEFGSSVATWSLLVELSELALAGFEPTTGQHYAVTVTDVCGHAVTAALPPR